MKRENIKQVIQDLAKENVQLYGKSDAATLAAGYWKTRLEDEIERDEKAGVTVSDYCGWVEEIMNDGE